MKDNNFGELDIVEGLERCNVILTLMSELLEGHPSVKEAGMEETLSKATSLVMDIYQKIGGMPYSRGYRTYMVPKKNKDKILGMLLQCFDRMDRARHILYKPGTANWGMLDTTFIKDDLQKVLGTEDKDENVDG